MTRKRPLGPPNENTNTKNTKFQLLYSKPMLNCHNCSLSLVGTQLRCIPVLKKGKNTVKIIQLQTYSVSRTLGTLYPDRGGIGMCQQASCLCQNVPQPQHLISPGLRMCSVESGNTEQSQVQYCSSSNKHSSWKRTEGVVKEQTSNRAESAGVHLLPFYLVQDTQLYNELSEEGTRIGIQCFASSGVRRPKPLDVNRVLKYAHFPAFHDISYFAGS